MQARSWNSRGSKRWFRLLIGGFFLLLQAACGGGGGGGSNPQPSVSPAQFNLTPGEAVPLSTAGLDPLALSWQSSDPAVATVDREGVVTGVAVGVASITASSNGISLSATVGVVSPNPGAASAEISGMAQYEDKPFDQNGPLATPSRLPMRHVVIHVIAIDGFVPVASGATAADGTFLFTNLNNAQRRGGLYLQILSKTGPASHPTQVEVRNNETEGALFGLVSEAVDDSFSPSSVRNPIADAAGIGGAFNLIDIFSSGSEMLQASGGCVPACIPPLLTAYWEPRGSIGTFYDDVKNAIFICGGGDSEHCREGDTDEYDDAVVAHEYGHFVLGHFSHDDSQGGVHVLSDNTQDIRLSWSEGWGSFFSSAVRESPLYLDTDEAGFFALDLEQVTSSDLQELASLALYTTNEVAVAAVLWDFLDTPDAPTPDDDPVALGMQALWQTVLAIASPATFESFWAVLAATSGDIGSLQTVLTGRQIELIQDPYETSGEEMLTPLKTQHHTLYLDPVGAFFPEDEDVIPFQVVSGSNYVLETEGLGNGADTFLSITDAAGVLIADLENDNRTGKTYAECLLFCPPNDRTTLSSSLSFQWSEPTTTLYARVRRSKLAPPSAALHGTYDIRLRSL